MKASASSFQYEPDLYLRVVSMTVEDAKAFFGADVVGSAEPVDLGPANMLRYKDGARVWGFPWRQETAGEKAHRIWTVAHGGTVEI